MDLSITGKKFTTTKLISKMPDSLIISAKTPSIKPSQPKSNVRNIPQQAKGRTLQSKSFTAQNKTNAKAAQKGQKQSKKERKQPIPAKKEEAKIELKPLKQEQTVQVLPKEQEKIGEVIVRYNHYKDKFECRNGMLSFLPIEQKYCFSGVFKGNFLPIIKLFKTNQVVLPETTGRAVQFSWKVEEQAEYRLQIQEDQAQEAKYEKKPFIAPKKQNECPFKKNSRVEYLTEQLKKLKPQEYGSDHHKRLLEERDLEDVLYG